MGKLVEEAGVRAADTFAVAHFGKVGIIRFEDGEEMAVVRVVPAARVGTVEKAAKVAVTARWEGSAATALERG